MLKESRNEYLLKLWKTRQEAEGYDVSSVKTLEEAEHFFDKKEKKLNEMNNQELIDVGKMYGLKLKYNTKKVELISILEERKKIIDEVNNVHQLTDAELYMSNDELKGLIEEVESNKEESKEEQQEPPIDGTIEEIDIPEITEEQVQAVANAIVEQAAEENKSINQVVNEVIEESKEEQQEPPIEVN